MITLRNGKQIQFVLAPSAPIPLGAPMPAPTPATMQTPSLTTPQGDVIYFPNCEITETGSGFDFVDSGAGRLYLAKINTPCGNGFRFYYRGNIRDLQKIMRDVTQYEVDQTEKVKESPDMMYTDDSIFPVTNGG